MMSGFPKKENKKYTPTVNFFLEAETTTDAGFLEPAITESNSQALCNAEKLKCKTHECGVSLTNEREKKKLFLNIKQFICKTSVITKAP